MCAHLIVTLRAVLLAAVLGLGWIAAPAVAAPPDNNADVYRAVRDGTAQSITFTAPADRTLIQSEGQTWRQWRNGPITQIGGWLLAGVFIALVLFRLVRGKIVLEGPPTGRLIQRFSTVERMTHWTVALTFVLLAITGLTLLFGKHVVIPVIGYSAFSWIAALGKNVHNFVGPLFFASTLVMMALFARDNVWQAIDALWIRKAGGLLSGEHVPSWRFNFGEKTWFWIGVVILGLTVGITGLVLDFPGYGQIRQDMQLAHIIHTSGAIIFIALSLGHIYIGSVGMEGALESMKTGYVDETWAREHHEYWYREAKGGSGAAPVASGAGRPSTAH
ncbi:formate dehydrogenase subunit gamma [Denitromonas ohlonensis]|uniref:Formate dehydrogenase subunit gamma n=2 Tax=Denitromonas TaxID=139331 RepID=A0A557RQD2_9RHOO|nr:formate dehydrogenase subunit gamma [Denitromonas ohlonensis]TVO67374.1 formate dehydrogenase subunit gamma [Denitromonas ohlonensis]TVO71993.1 formate dehydrogenase subunit gamma [Denitromonas ohlonensis]TVT51256.1 MAG: formate dehydrogenase subunit gamma [Denitromonas halophila]TVT74346.1 MAG: formate dehydrogenase subunit gamma [Denitromonas halophila]